MHYKGITNTPPRFSGGGISLIISKLQSKTLNTKTMKKLFLLLVVAIGSLLYGCTDAGVEETPKFEFADGANLSPEIAPSGGNATIYFFSPLYWSVTADSWITVSPRSGEAGNSSIVIKLSSNKTGETRIGAVTISLSNGESYVISVSQESEDVFGANSQNKYQIGISGGEISVKVTTNIDYTVDIPENAQSWLSLANSRALREENLTFRVAKNETYDTREAVVKLLDKDKKVLQSFTVVQSCEEVFDTNAKEEYTVSEDGGSVEIVVATNMDYRVEIPTAAQSWVHLADTRAYRNEKLTLTIDKNANYEPRTATIKLLGDNSETLQEFSIKQAEKKGLNSDAPTEYAVESGGGLLEVNVSTNIDYTVDIPTDAQSWVNLADTRALRNEKLTFTIAANDKTTPRSTTVSIKNSNGTALYEILIRQKEKIIFDNSKDSGLYLGIIGFNHTQYSYPIQRLTSRSVDGYNSFIDELTKSQVGTLLYYTMDKSINELQNNLFPEDLYNVSIVTFTDGLDEGSLTLSNYLEDTDYLSALNTRLTNETVSGKRIASYTVGVKGPDAESNPQLFQSNLDNLATSTDNVFNANNMSEVNAAFFEIAKNLGETNTYYSLALQVTAPENQAKCRFTFDDVTTYNSSQKYIEGTCNTSIVNNERVVTLEDIEYVGITSETGSQINFVRNGESIFYELKFEGLQADDREPIVQDKIQYWRTKQGSWGLNSEFDPNNNATLDKIKRTAAIMLNLDCSGSLGDNFSTLQSSAKNFVSTLLEYTIDPEEVTSVSLNKSSVTLSVGSTTTLKATVLPTTAHIKDVNWSSSNSNVASVSQSGVVTAKSAGSATITATTVDGGFSATCTVTVTEAPQTYDYIENAGKSLNMKMVYVEGGSFQMGATSEQGSDAESNESPVHTVSLDSYYIAECEVTQAQWYKIMGTTISEQKSKAGYSSTYGTGDNYPMYYVNWTEATEFCEKLSQLTGKTYVLPTEAQWEYAARGGKHNEGTKYSGSNTIGNVAWYYDNSSSTTHPVKQKSANALGLYDMSGNVYEWCSDWYGSYSSSAQTNPTGPSSGSSRVLRGGSWYSRASYCRVANRLNNAPSSRSSNYGFRVVCLP